MLLDEYELIPKIKELINDDTKDVVISSAYMKSDLLKELQSTLNNKNVSIYVRWEINDLINGASDLDIYKICMANGWKLWRNGKLHAKFILIDQSVVILGSSRPKLVSVFASVSFISPGNS